MNVIIKILIIFFLTLLAESKAKENFYTEAKNLYEKKNYDEAKFLFQKNIVFNPKDAKSYLYLARIFESENNPTELEKNLNISLLLEPDNEEAMYMLIDIELKKSNFSKVKKLTKSFNLICSSLCEKNSSINERLKNFQEKNDS